MSFQSFNALVIEDDCEILDFLVSEFKGAGIATQGLLSSENVVHTLNQMNPHIVVLDLMMPKKSGIDVMREIRSQSRFSDLPILIVSGRQDEQERIQALEMGADDYVVKPFMVKELIARVQALIRRSQGQLRANQLNLPSKNLSMDFLAHRVVLGGQEVPLTLTEFKILRELLHQSGQVLTRDKLRSQVLGSLNVSDRTIDVHMASLRKKLDPMRDMIETVRGVGYRLSV
jgi:two-component system phosphate regulon response regulator PhoB